MDDLGINKWLEENYGSYEGLPLFRVIWSTNVTEVRRARFIDMSDDLLVRDVIETREVLKYPMAQDRWILEILTPVPESIYDVELFTKLSYEGLYTFQDKEENFLPLNKTIVEVLLFFHFTGRQTPWHEKFEKLSEGIRNRDIARKESIRQSIGEVMRSPYFFVVEDRMPIRKIHIKR